jgi:hypothetical protein
LIEPHDKHTKESYSWDTSDLPEGRYRVQVAASDELANPPGEATSHIAESSVVLVDNTSPTFAKLEVAGRVVRATALDGVGPIARFEVALAGTDDWIPFHPVDQIFDEQREEFEADISSIAPAGRALLLSVRVYDEAGNYTVRSLPLR